MKHTHPISSDLDQNPALVRAFRSLRMSHVKIITRVVDAFGGDWSVQTGDDYDGYFFMLVEPPAEHREHLPTYMVSGRTGQIELSKVHGDNCQTLGRFEDIYALTVELTACLLGRANQLGVSAA